MFCVRVRFDFTCLTLVGHLLVLVACEASSPSTAPVTYSQVGTCASTCQKSVAAACSAGPSNVPTCTSECEAQIARCDDPAIVARYLDCVESTPMTCGEFTKAASSAECVTPGLTYGACIAGLTPGADTVQSEVTDDVVGGAEVVTGDVADLVAPGVAAGELVAIIRDGASDTEIRCTAAAAESPLASVTVEDGGTTFQVTCITGANPAKEHHALTLRWWQSSVDKGSYADSQVTEFTLHLVTANVGFSALATGALSPGMSFTLQLDSAAVPGGALRGSILASWTDAYSYAGKGSSATFGPRAGQLAVSFDLPL